MAGPSWPKFTPSEPENVTWLDRSPAGGGALLPCCWAVSVLTRSLPSCAARMARLSEELRKICPNVLTTEKGFSVLRTLGVWLALGLPPVKSLDAALVVENSRSLAAEAAARDASFCAQNE